MIAVILKVIPLRKVFEVVDLRKGIYLCDTDCEIDTAKCWKTVSSLPASTQCGVFLQDDWVPCQMIMFVLAFHCIKISLVFFFYVLERDEA